jgi:hypothetical protein
MSFTLSYKSTSKNIHHSIINMENGVDTISFLLYVEHKWNILRYTGHEHTEVIQFYWNKTKTHPFKSIKFKCNTIGFKR